LAHTPSPSSLVPPLPPPPRPSLFPYTPLFRSVALDSHHAGTEGTQARAGVAEGGHAEGRRPGRHRHRVVLHSGHLLRGVGRGSRSEEHTSELQSRFDLVCRLLLEKKNTRTSTK